MAGREPQGFRAYVPPRWPLCPCFLLVDPGCPQRINAQQLCLWRCHGRPYLMHIRFLFLNKKDKETQRLVVCLLV